MVAREIRGSPFTPDHSSSAKGWFSENIFGPADSDCLIVTGARMAEPRSFVRLSVANAFTKMK